MQGTDHLILDGGYHIFFVDLVSFGNFIGFRGYFFVHINRPDYLFGFGVAQGPLY